MVLRNETVRAAPEIPEVVRVALGVRGAEVEVVEWVRSEVEDVAAWEAAVVAGATSLRLRPSMRKGIKLRTVQVVEAGVVVLPAVHTEELVGTKG